MKPFVSFRSQSFLIPGILTVVQNLKGVEEIVSQAFQFTDEHGEVCPAGWRPGEICINWIWAKSPRNRWGFFLMEFETLKWTWIPYTKY